jgi:hypothetical protein
MYRFRDIFDVLFDSLIKHLLFFCVKIKETKIHLKLLQTVQEVNLNGLESPGEDI